MRASRMVYSAASAEMPRIPMAAQAKFILRALVRVYPRALSVSELAVEAESCGMSTRQLPELVVRYYLPLLVSHAVVIKTPKEK